MAKLATIQDLFTETTLNGTIWTQFTGGSATMTYGVSGGSSYLGAAAQVNFPGTTSSSTDGDIATATGDLTNSHVLLNVLSVSGASATHTDCGIAVKISSSSLVKIFYEAGTLFFSQIVAGTQTNNASVAYNAVTHAWWGMFESGGTLYWCTAPDGTNWTVQYSASDPITLTSVFVDIYGVCFGVDTSPSPFTFRYFNYPNGYKPGNVITPLKIDNNAGILSAGVPSN